MINHNHSWHWYTWFRRGSKAIMVFKCVCGKKEIEKISYPRDWWDKVVDFILGEVDEEDQETLLNNLR